MNVIYISGCSCTGKTTLARLIIERSGGITDFRDGFTATKSNIVLAGRYQGIKYGGYDDMGKFKKPPFDHKTFIYEGTRIGRVNSEIGDFIIENNGVLVFMYAPLKTIAERLKARSNTKVTPNIIKDFKAAYSAAKKFKEIGLRVITLNASELTTEQCYNQIKQYLHNEKTL
ncbi:hypothetical protein FACS189434_09300 [Bacteroidia bacterium]|nr:hypothetical protein FACS189434_09300 [Bacteroidia bacterium]